MSTALPGSQPPWSTAEPTAIHTPPEIGDYGEGKAANVVEALARVVRDLPAIGKDEQAAAQQGGYSYRGIEAITRQVQPLLAKHGVVFVPRVVGTPVVVDLVVNGKPWTDHRMLVAYTVYGPGGRDDRIEVGPIATVGRDNSDKGANKCMTQAFKYALLQVLCVSDSADDADGLTHEADDVPTGPPLAARDETDAFLAMVKASPEETRAAMNAWWKERIGARGPTEDELSAAYRHYATLDKSSGGETNAEEEGEPVAPASADAETPDEAPTPPSDREETPPRTDRGTRRADRYVGYKKDDLKGALSIRGLDTTGTVAEMTVRLLDDDGDVPETWACQVDGGCAQIATVESKGKRFCPEHEPF